MLSHDHQISLAHFSFLRTSRRYIVCWHLLIGNTIEQTAQCTGFTVSQVINDEIRLKKELGATCRTELLIKLLRSNNISIDTYREEMLKRFKLDSSYDFKSDLARLTKSQYRALELLFEGKTAKEIAAHWDKPMKEAAAQDLLLRIHRDLKVRSIAELIGKVFLGDGFEIDTKCEPERLVLRKRFISTLSYSYPPTIKTMKEKIGWLILIGKTVHDITDITGLKSTQIKYQTILLTKDYGVTEQNNLLFKMLESGNYPRDAYERAMLCHFGFTTKSEAREIINKKVESLSRFEHQVFKNLIHGEVPDINGHPQPKVDIQPYMRDLFKKLGVKKFTELFAMRYLADPLAYSPIQ